MSKLRSPGPRGLFTMSKNLRVTHVSKFSGGPAPNVQSAACLLCQKKSTHYTCVMCSFFHTENRPQFIIAITISLPASVRTLELKSGFLSDISTGYFYFINSDKCKYKIYSNSFSVSATFKPSAELPTEAENSETTFAARTLSSMKFPF